MQNLVGHIVTWKNTQRNTLEKLSKAKEKVRPKQ